MTLAALLKELQEVDEEEWEEILDWFGGLKRGLHDESISPHHDLGQALIQNSIQRACERRGWALTLEYVSWYAPMRRWHAYISTGPRGCDTKDTAADSAAEALLAAYIAAV